MNDGEFTKLCQDVLDLVSSGEKIKAIKLWRQKTGQGLQDAKRNIEQLEAGNRVDALTNLSPTLLKEYQSAVQSSLAMMPSLTVLDAMEHVPTLQRYLGEVFDKWYTIYKDALETSIFNRTQVNFGEDDQSPAFGDQTRTYLRAKTESSRTRRRWNDDDEWLCDMASKYDEAIKKISMHCQMLKAMASTDFPGRKSEGEEER